MKTIRTTATVSPDGTLTARVPPEVPPGEHRVVLMLQEQPAPEEESDLDRPVIDVGPWPEGLSLRRTERTFRRLPQETGGRGASQGGGWRGRAAETPSPFPRPEGAGAIPTESERVSDPHSAGVGMVACWLHTLEGLNERLVCDAYGLDEGDVQAVVDETGTPAGWYPLVAGYEALPPWPEGVARGLDPDLAARLGEFLGGLPRLAPDAQALARLKGRLVALYRAGPGARVEEDDGEGAGEEDEGAALGARIPIPTETFLEELSQRLEVHPISVYWLLRELQEQEGLVCPPELKRQLEDYASVSILRLLGYRWPEQDAYEQERGPILDPALVVEDGILPLVRWGGQPTAADLVRRRLERDFGEEGAARAEAEFQRWVGRGLEEWLRRDFFRRHVQQFKQRPIAWHLASPERTFEALVLYHRLSRATLQRLRAVYAGGLSERLKAEQERARAQGKEAEVSRLRARLEDVEEFRARLEAIERGAKLKYRVRCRWKGEEAEGRPGPYAPDIDDGVKVNLHPFQEAGLLAVREVIKKW